MESCFVVELLKNGNVLPDSTQILAKVYGHPDIGTWFSDNLIEILTNIGQAIAAKYGIGTYDYGSAMALAK